MAIYMPPIARKKRVSDRYNPDSFRVISTDAEESHPKYRHLTQSLDRQMTELELPSISHRSFSQVLPHCAQDYRANKPHPRNCGFLRSDVRLLNEPICSVFTDSTREEQRNWWPSRISSEPLRRPEFTRDTTYRGDFLQAEKENLPLRSLRHTANPNKEPALGAVPVNFLRPRNNRQRLIKEKISFEHIYNSRLDPNYPIRSKRQGSFVWDPLKPDQAERFLNYHNISVEEGMARQRHMETEKARLSEPEPVQPPSPKTEQVETACPQPDAATTKLASPKSGSPVEEKTNIVAEKPPSPKQVQAPKEEAVKSPGSPKSEQQNCFEANQHAEVQSTSVTAESTEKEKDSEPSEPVTVDKVACPSSPKSVEMGKVDSKENGSSKIEESADTVESK